MRKISSSWGFSIAFLILVNLAVFSQVTEFDYVAYDEPSGIHTNPHINSPFTAASLVDMFTSIDKSSNQYTPLSLLSFWLEKNLIGMDSGISHLLNLMLHLLCVVSVFFLAGYLCSQSSLALLIALFWSIHPVQVETVCWVLERRNLLYGFGLFSSLLFYARYCETKKNSDFYMALVFMIFSGIAKTLAFLIPLLWLIIDTIKGRKPSFELVREKVLVLAPAMVMLIVLAVGATGGMTRQTGLLLNVHKPAYALSLYVGKTLLPVNLLPVLEINSTCAYMIGSGLYIFVFTALMAIIIARNSLSAKMGLLFFIVTILPLSGIVRVGLNFYGAYHFMYVPLFGLIFAIFCCLERFMEYRKKTAWVALAILLAIPLAALSHATAGIWKNTETLYSYVLRHDPESEFARRNLAVFLSHSGKLDSSIYHYKELLQRYPHLVHDRYNLACIMLKNGDRTGAKRHFSRLVIDAPAFDKAAYGLGMIMFDGNDFAAAQKWFSQAIQLNPQNAESFFSRALVSIKQEKFYEAELDLNMAVKINARHVQAFWQRHFLLSRRADYRAAISDLMYLRTLFSYDYSLLRKQTILFWQSAQLSCFVAALIEYCANGIESEAEFIRNFLAHPDLEFVDIPAMLPYWNLFRFWVK